VSLKEDDPRDVTEAKARELYAAKLQAEREKTIADFGDVKILNGRFGPYITDGKKNAKIPKDSDPKAITEEEAKKIIAETPARKPRTRGRK
jgi:DNA topoisomerase-1